MNEIKSHSDITPIYYIGNQEACQLKENEIFIDCPLF